VIRRRALAGGSTDDVITIDGYPTGLTFLGSRLFWSSGEKGETTGNRIASASLESLNIVVLLADGFPTGLAATTDRVYWADFQYGLYDMTHSDGVPTGTPEAFGGWANARDVRLWSDMLFWTQINLDNSIRSRHLDGAASAIVACNQYWPQAVVVDDDSVYWINADVTSREGRIMKQDRAAGRSQVLLDGLQHPVGRSLTGDATHLYWVEATTIKRMQK